MCETCETCAKIIICNRCRRQLCAMKPDEKYGHKCKIEGYYCLGGAVCVECYQRIRSTPNKEE